MILTELKDINGLAAIWQGENKNWVTTMFWKNKFKISTKLKTTSADSVSLITHDDKNMKQQATLWSTSVSDKVLFNKKWTA